MWIYIITTCYALKISPHNSLVSKINFPYRVCNAFVFKNYSLAEVKYLTKYFQWQTRIINRLAPTHPQTRRERKREKDNIRKSKDENKRSTFFRATPPNLINPYYHIELRIEKTRNPSPSLKRAGKGVGEGFRLCSYVIFCVIW